MPLRVLGRILNAVQRLVDQRDDLVDTDKYEDAFGEHGAHEQRTLQLLDVKAASAGYAVASADRAATLAVLRETGKGIKAPDLANWHPSAISSIEELSQMARQLGCVIEFRNRHKGNALGDIIATIVPETSAEIRHRAFTYGFTSVYGRLEGVGGSTAMRCRIHVHDRLRMLFCDVESAELAQELGKHIYRDVVLTGEGTWYRSNGQLKSLQVTSFDPAKTESFADVARQIREAGGRAWDAIADPTAYIREMRG